MNRRLLAVALLTAVSACRQRVAGPLPGPISIHASCTQTLYPLVGAYSGNLALVQWERGVVVVNVTTGLSQFVMGTWRAVSPGGCTGKASLLWDTNDYWQSVINLTASNGSPKWLLTPASPYGAACTGRNCNPPRDNMGGVTYWKWNGSAYQVIDLIQPPSGLQVFDKGTPVLDGDTAWVKLNQNKGWAACNLPANSCDWTHPQPNPPAGEGRQANVAGATYDVGPDHSHPNENGGPVWFLMTRNNLGVTPTPAPVPTQASTPGPQPSPGTGGNPYAQYIEAITRAGITSGCGGGNFCPDRDMTREEVAVWLAKAMKLPLAPCAGTYHDVPCPPPGAATQTKYDPPHR